MLRRAPAVALLLVGFALFGLSRLYVQESAPSARIRDSLVEGVRYTATAVGAGFSNQLIGYIMLLQYARKADRVPILGDFVARSNDNILTKGPVAPYLLFETVFDLSAYTAATGQAVTTFAAFKSPSSTPETLQCFASGHRTEQPPLHGVTAGPAWSSWSTAEGVDMDVWDAPSSVNVRWGPYLNVSNLVNFSEDPLQWEAAISQAKEDRKVAEALGEVEPRQSSAVPAPELACWSDLYWAFETEDKDERWNAWPAWDAAGTHLRFAPALKKLAGEYLRRVFGDEPRPFIAIHARHGDFGCPNQKSPRPASDQDGASCYRAASSYLPTVESFRTRLADEQDVKVSADSVIVFSDEMDERWWEGVAAMGWKRIDHDKVGTTSRLDNWWPTLIDMVLMSQAKGFIGTRGSTYSLLSSRRVTDWQQGIVALETR